MESPLKYTQNDEEQAILRYFGNHVGTVVDIGANDGTTFSNSARLIELGWSAHLVEPHRLAYEKMTGHYADNPKVKTYNYAITSVEGKLKFYNCADSLLSTTNAEQVNLWPGQPFEESEVDSITWEQFKILSGVYTIDFISIDAEGSDWSILQQIDLTNVSMVCIEVGEEKTNIMRYCLDAGMRLYHKTFENIIFCK